MGRSVSEAIWNWREEEQRAAHKSGAAELRRAALLQAGLLGAVGVVLFFALGHAVLAWVVWGLGGLCLMLGLLHPPSYRPLHRFGQILGRGVGQLLVHLLLVPFYYLFFFPVAAYLRLRGRDPMHRRFRPPDLTYWIPHRHAAPPGIYERQFLKEDPHARGLHRPVGSLPETAKPE
jgi:hypothetical protein